MVFHFKLKSREIRFDNGWNSVFEWHFKPIVANLKWNFVFIQLICRESVFSYILKCIESLPRLPLSENMLPESLVQREIQEKSIILGDLLPRKRYGQNTVPSAFTYKRMLV